LSSFFSLSLATTYEPTFYEFINIDEFVKNQRARHCEECSDEAIPWNQILTKYEIASSASGGLAMTPFDTFYEFINIELIKIKSQVWKKNPLLSQRRGEGLIKKTPGPIY